MTSAPGIKEDTRLCSRVAGAEELRQRAETGSCCSCGVVARAGVGLGDAVVHLEDDRIMDHDLFVTVTRPTDIPMSKLRRKH